MRKIHKMVKTNKIIEIMDGLILFDELASGQKKSPGRVAVGLLTLLSQYNGD